MRGSRFEPRVPSAGGNPVVWAIDEEHLPNYLLPRDCPRVTFFVAESTSAEDAERFLLGSSASRVVAIESGWLKKVSSASLVRYGFASRGFVLQDAVAGYHVSSNPVKPLEEVKMMDLIGTLAGLGVELRVMPSLWEVGRGSSIRRLGFRSSGCATPDPRQGGTAPIPWTQSSKPDTSVFDSDRVTRDLNEFVPALQRQSHPCFAEFRVWIDPNRAVTAPQHRVRNCAIRWSFLPTYALVDELKVGLDVGVLGMSSYERQRKEPGCDPCEPI